MTQQLLINFSKSLKYHNYDNAKFIGSILLNLDPKYHLLLPISLYLDGEYSRSIFFLTEIDTYTSNFYLALNYMKIKEFKKAVVCIKKIINEKCKDDTSIHFSCDYLLVNKQDKNYFNDILGDLYVQLMEKDESIKAFTACYIEDPLFNSIENLLNENLIPIFDENKKEGPVAEYITDVMKYYNDLSEFVISKYINKIPGIGSYVLANVAKKLFDLSLLSDSRKCFYLLISKDPKLLYNMDYFSTVLWHGSDITDLGILCKNLITNSPNEAITWKALGNFYNHKNDYQRSMLCFKRSLYIKNDYYTNTLLGYESIHKNEYETALSFFRRSCFMLRDNYKAIFGCGLVYDKMEKKELAEGHFNSALQKNPKNKHIKILSMKFYIKQGDMDTAIKIFADGMGFETTDIDKMTELVLKRGGGFTDIEEFLVLEFAEILMKLNLMEHSTKMLKIVECRGDTYYRKRDLIYERNTSV